jgi:hypothetical protein
MVGVTVSRVHLVELHSVQLFAPGGDVNVWVRRVARELKEASQGFAPPRRSMAKWSRPGTGRLMASIRGDATWDGSKDFNIFLSANTPYATYVLKGTASQGRNYIYTTLGYANRRQIAGWVKKKQFQASAEEAGNYMPLPPHGQFKQTKYLRVHGQKANPFLIDGYHLVSRRHKALPRLALRTGAFPD